jgi:hypothetical protein
MLEIMANIAKMTKMIDKRIIEFFMNAKRSRVPTPRWDSYIVL